MNLTLEPTQKINAKSKPIAQRRFRVNSFGLRLFLMIMGGVIAGMGGMAFLFGETVKYQAEDQIESTLSNKVGIIKDVIDQAEILAYGLNISVKTLHVRKAETPETYQELTRQLFLGRPQFVTGLGFGQKDSGILPSRQWFFPYYQSVPSGTAVFSTDTTDTLPATPASTEIVYVDQVKPEYFYPETDRYRDYFLSQENRWTTPYASDRGLLLTYYSQIFNDQGTWLGTAVIDIDATHLSRVLNQPVFREGGEMLLLTQTGEMIANPTDPTAVGTQTYEDVPELRDIWPQISPEESGFLEGETGYWAYTQIPERDWILLAHVPYGTVFGPVTLITLGATTAAGVLLVGVVVLAIRHLNRRLQPVLNECHRLSEIDDTMANKLRNKDELEQLSLSFFNLLEQLARQQPILNRVTQRMRSLEEVVITSADEGQQQSQLVTQVQRWVDDTNELSQTLTTQALNVKAVSRVNLGALDRSQKQMTALAAQLDVFGEKIHPLPEQIEELVDATTLTTRVTEAHHQIVNITKALLQNGITLSTQASQPPVSRDFKETATQFQQLAGELQTLTHQLSQALRDQNHRGEQIQAKGLNLCRQVRTFDRYLQELNTLLEASQSELQSGQLKAHRLTEAGEQVTESSQQLRELVQTMQPQVKTMVAIAHTTQTRLQSRT